MRFVGLASAIGVIGVAGAAGATKLRGGRASGITETAAGSVSLRQERRSTKAGSARTARPLRTLTSTPEPVLSAAGAPPAPAWSGESLLALGRTTLTENIYAVRNGDSVTVNFDAPVHRTRRADKFELIVRATLPMVYGRRVASALDTVPAGSLLPSRDVMGELASQGVHLMLDNGLKISVWPQMRASGDGPLVVAYRTVVER